MKTLLLTALFLTGISIAAMAGLPQNFQGFAAWAIVAKGLPSGGEHMGKGKVVYANPIAAKAWKSKASMPVGSLIAKAPGDPGSAKWVATMQKIAKGWSYQEFVLRSGRYVLADEPQAECIECHERVKANDYLFSRK